MQIYSQDVAKIKVTYETKFVNDSLNKEKIETYDYIFRNDPFFLPFFWNSAE